MAKGKRSLATDDTADLAGAHPDRRKRVKYSEADAQLASTYNDLADEVPAVRIKAAGELLKRLSTKSDDQQQRLDAAESRLIKGLCSGRKAARLGFSIALAEVFRLRFGLPRATGFAISLSGSLEKIAKLTEVQGNVSGQERRDYLLGRRFAYQALLHSDVGHSVMLVPDEWRQLIDAIFALAAQKQWLRRECGVVLYEYLVSPSGAKLGENSVNKQGESRIKDIMNAAEEHKFLKTPEGLGLWITVADRFAHVKLPSDVWHHRNPLSSKERSTVSRVMLENAGQDEEIKSKAGARQITPSFAWKVLLDTLYQQDNTKAFKHFWEETVVNGMFAINTSAERRALGLQVCSLAVATAPVLYLRQVLHNNILRCILDQRAESNRYLFDAAKAPLQQLVTRAKAEPEVAAVACSELIDRQLLNLDQATKTKTLEGLLQHAANDQLVDIVGVVYSSLDDLKRQGAAVTDQPVKALADFTLSIVRQRKEDGVATFHDFGKNKSESKSWLVTALQYMANLSYSAHHWPGDKTMVRSRLMSCLNTLLSSPLNQVLKAPVIVARSGLRGTTESEQSLDRALDIMEEEYNRTTEDSENAADARAFVLLFALSVVQVNNEEPDAEAALQDLITCYESRHDKGDSLTMLVELLLSFISKPSALFRKLAEQAFSAFAGDLTADSLQSLVDILGQNESLKGQQELFDENRDGDQDAKSDSDGEEDGIDVEDASDVELVNGEEASAADSEDDDASSSSSSADSAAEAGAEDEEAAFDAKLAEALGTNGLDDADSDASGSDMDDDQMLALEPHLTSIFRERQKTTSKKQDKKDARENIVNFKNRVLDLLMIYVKGQYANVLALDLILPLCVLTRETGSKPTAEKAFALLKTYFDACNKHKTLPSPADHEALFTLLSALHQEMKAGQGARLHANACSRSSLFLAKVLVGLNTAYYERVAGMYATLQGEWWLGKEGAGKVQGSVFTEWTSWSIGTRKAGGV